MGVDVEMRERLQEYAKDARHVVDAAEEALRHLDSGDEQAACDVVSLSHYKLGSLTKEWNGLMEAFAAHNLKPGQGGG